MRKQRLAAFFATFMLAGTMLAGDIAITATPATAATVHRTASTRRVAARRTTRRRIRRIRHLAVQPIAAPVGADVWQRLRACESGDNYGIATGNGYYGAYQFTARTWQGLGYSGLPHQAPPQVQDEAAQRLQARSGWGQWPSCSRKIGVR